MMENTIQNLLNTMRKWKDCLWIEDGLRGEEPRIKTNEIHLMDSFDGH